MTRHRAGSATRLPLERIARDLLDAAPDAIVVVDRSGRIAFVNLEAQRVFGYDRGQLLGEPIELLLPERFRARHGEHRDVYCAEPRLRPMGGGLDLVARHRDGSEFPVEISLSPLHTPEGVLVTASVRDVSDRKRLEAEKDELLAEAQQARAEAEGAREEIGRLSAVTEVAISDLSSDEMLRELLGRVHTLLAVDVATMLLLETNGQGIDADARVLRVRATIGQDEDLARTRLVPLGAGFAGRVAAAGASLRVEDIDDIQVINPALRVAGVRSMLGVPLFAGGDLLGVLEVGTYERRAFTSEDVRLLQLVAERVGLAVKRTSLYDAEQRARAAAEASLRLHAETERLKDDLTAMVVHDLKNPVNGILMMVQLSLRKGGDLSEALRQRLRQIEMTCGEMTRLIQNLLEISKMEGGQMPIAREIVGLREVLAEIEQEYGPVAQQMTRRLHMHHVGEPAVALGDRSLIKRVVINLVVNALRHSGSSEVFVESATEARRGVVTIRVTDRGRGIPATDRARIFEKFAVVRRSIGDPSGDTGLGLPFCKLAVDRMGGEIRLESDPGETVFIVELPAGDQV